MTRRAGILVLATAALAAAATDPVAAILDQARGTPVEIFADVTFRLIDAGKISEKDRAALLDEVFLRADEARRTIVTHPAVIPAPFLGLAEVHLDALAIKCRVVKAMLDVDGKRSRERFNEIPPARVSRPECKDALVADPTAYFDTLAEVVTKAQFSAEEQKKQIPFWMMADAVRGIQTSLEIIAAARNFSQLVRSEKDALAMSSAFTAALGIDDCNRNFSAAMHSSNLVDAVLMAGDRFAKLGAPPQAMQAALRAYLVRHLTAARCEDSNGLEYSTSLAYFEAHHGTETAFQTISEAESAPAKLEGKVESTTQHQSEDSLELFKEVGALDPLGPVTNGVRYISAKDLEAVDAAAPISEVQRVLAKLREWHGNPDQDAIEVFHRKAGLYFSLLSLFRGSLRPAILSGMIDTLADTSILNSSPADWLYEVNHFDRATRHTTERVDGKEVTKYLAGPGNLEAMLDSNFSALVMYGRLAMLGY